jgi:hypothetical protein
MFGQVKLAKNRSEGGRSSSEELRFKHRSPFTHVDGGEETFYYLLQLCQDIYLARERGEFEMERKLFQNLIFLHTSSESLVRWTQPPREVHEGEEDMSTVRKL